MARNYRSAEARGEGSKVGIFTNINKTNKREEKKRYQKYPLMTKHITDFVLQGWYSGSPVTRHACYKVAREMNVIGDKF